MVLRNEPFQGEESDFFASVKTYLLGELATYSEKTLRLYEQYLDDLERRGENISRVILENTVKKYGFASLDEAESHTADRGSV
ncbi:MAG: DUF4125 family protein [Treponema sp.]|jgi:hypothetical protein|nr:DUF4125 family protein [Treponema sp.]